MAGEPTVAEPGVGMSCRRMGAADDGECVSCFAPMQSIPRIIARVFDIANIRNRGLWKWKTPRAGS